MKDGDLDEGFGGGFSGRGWAGSCVRSGERSPGGVGSFGYAARR
jgi:hypothetical protein